MLIKNAKHVLGVFGVASERTHARCGTSRSGIGVTGHERGDRTGEGTAFVGVVRKTKGHEKRTEVGITKTELTELAGVVADRNGRVIGVADEDFLRGEHDFDRVLVGIDVEHAVFAEVMEKVDAGKVASGIVDVHVFRARVRTIDATGVARGVPVVDRGVELHAGVGAFPGRLRDLTHEIASTNGLDDFATVHGTQVPIGVVDHGLHELVGDAN